MLIRLTLGHLDFFSGYCIGVQLYLTVIQYFNFLYLIADCINLVNNIEHSGLKKIIAIVVLI